MSTTTDPILDTAGQIADACVSIKAIDRDIADLERTLSELRVRRAEQHRLVASLLSPVAPGIDHRATGAHDEPRAQQFDARHPHGEAVIRKLLSHNPSELLTEAVKEALGIRGRSNLLAAKLRTMGLVEARNGVAWAVR